MPCERQKHRSIIHHTRPIHRICRWISRPKPESEISKKDRHVPRETENWQDNNDKSLCSISNWTGITIEIAGTWMNRFRTIKTRIAMEIANATKAAIAPTENGMRIAAFRAKIRRRIASPTMTLNQTALTGVWCVY